MSQKTFVAIFSALLFSAPTLAAGEQTVVCPERLMQQSAQVNAENIPDGFEFMSRPGRLWLSGLSLYDGHPRDNAVLAPSDESATEPVWRFEGDYFDGKWLSCDYGMGHVRLYRKLDDAVAECHAALEGSRQEGNLKIRAVCR